MAMRHFATHHVRVLSLAIAYSVGESIVQQARAVKSDYLGRARAYARSAAPLPTVGA